MTKFADVSKDYTIGTNLRNLREHNEYTVTMLAYLTGLAVEDIEAFEADQAQISEIVIASLAIAYEMGYVELSDLCNIPVKWEYTEEDEKKHASSHYFIDLAKVDNADDVWNFLEANGLSCDKSPLGFKRTAIVLNTFVECASYVRDDIATLKRVYDYKEVLPKFYTAVKEHTAK